jgi:hypothetical protein
MATRYSDSVIRLLMEGLEEGEKLVFCEDCGVPFVQHHTYKKAKCIVCASQSEHTWHFRKKGEKK